MQSPLQVILKSRARKGGIPGMRLERLCMAALSILCVPAVAVAGPSNGIITGRVTYTGTSAKPEPINMSKQPECAKLYTRPLMTEKVVIGPGNTLQNGRVHIRWRFGLPSGACVAGNLRSAELPLHHARARLSSGAGCEYLKQRPVVSQYSPDTAAQSRMEQATATDNSPLFLLLR